LIKDSIYTLLTRVLVIIGKIAYSIIINRTLGPIYKGVFELVQLAPDTLARGGALGFDQANIYFTGKDRKNIPDLISNSFGLMARFSLPAVALGVIYLNLPVNQKIFDYTPPWAGYVAVLIIPAIILDLLLEGILYGQNRVWVRNWHEIIRIISALIFMTFWVVIMKMQATGAVIGYVTINAILLIFIFIVMRIYHTIKIKKLDIKLAWNSFRFGRFPWIANFASYLFYKIDIWLLSALYIPAVNPAIFQSRSDLILEQVGLYSTAVNIIVTIWIIPDSVQTAMLPKITQKGESERKKLVPPSLRAVTIIVFLAMVGLALIGKPAINLMYNRPDTDWDFTKAYIPLMLLMPGIFTLSLAKVFTADLFSRGKPQYAMWVSVTSLIINLVLNISLIPKWGMYGAAIASSISYTFSFLLFCYFYIKESGERSRDVFLPKKTDFVLIREWVTAWYQSNINKRS